MREEVNHNKTWFCMDRQAKRNLFIWSTLPAYLLVVEMSDWNDFHRNEYGWTEDHRIVPCDVNRLLSDCRCQMTTDRGAILRQPIATCRPICSDAPVFAFEIETSRRHLVITGTLTSRDLRSQGQTASSPRTQWHKSTRTSPEFSVLRQTRSADGGRTFHCLYVCVYINERQ